MTINKNDKMIKINVKEMAANNQLKPVLEFTGKEPLDVDAARAYFQKKAMFFANRLERAVNRPAPLLSENDDTGNDTTQFQCDVEALIYMQKCRSALESAMNCDEKITLNCKSITTFQKASDKTILIEMQQ